MPALVTYRLSDAKIATKTLFSQVERGPVDHLTRSLALEIPANTDLKLFGRPGESAEEFAARCAAFADERADEAIAKLRDTYEAKAMRLRDQIAAAEDRAERLTEQLAELQADAAADISEIAEKWDTLAANVTTLSVRLERTDVKVTQLALAWVPVA